MTDTQTVTSEGRASSQQTEPQLLQVEELRTYFRSPRGVVKAVDGVSFELNRGETIGLVGESGSGKSVTSRSIMGLINRRNAERTGRVIFRGTDVSDYEDAQFRSLWATEMAMIFQDPMTALNPVMKVGNQVGESLRVHLNMSKAEARANSIALLRSVGIPEAEKRVDVYPHEMSGGMRQRVVIALALACGPKLLFADEPTTALDVTVQAQVLDLLAQQQRERFMGMILVTHDLGVVAGRADEICVMYAGKVVERAKTRDLFTDLRMPYTESLLAAIPKLEMPSHTRLEAIGGRPPDLVDPPTGCGFSPRCPYAQDKCRQEPPPMLETSPGSHHFYRCWFPVGSPDNDAIKVELRRQGKQLPGAGAIETAQEQLAEVAQARPTENAPKGNE